MPDNKDIYSDADLIEFRNLHGKVAKVPIDDIDVYMRSLKFGDWTELVRGTDLKVNEKGEVRYDISDKLIAQYVIPCVLKPIPLPETITSKPYKINLIVQTVLNITDYDKVEIMFKKYTKALGRQQLLAMEIKRRLVATYGIQIWSHIKDANIDDIIELVAMGEWISQSLGDFGRTLGVDDLIPMKRKGKNIVIDEDKLSEVLNQWLYDYETEVATPKQPTISNVAVPPPPPIPEKMPLQVNDAKLDTIMKQSPPPPQVIQQPVPSKPIMTISDVEEHTAATKQQQINSAKHPDLNILKEPKLYDAHPDTMSPYVLERSKKEFGGSLTNMWNENQVALYDKIHEDSANPTTFKSLGDIQKEDDKSNVVLSELNNG